MGLLPACDGFCVGPARPASEASGSGEREARASFLRAVCGALVPASGASLFLFGGAVFGAGVGVAPGQCSRGMGRSPMLPFQLRRSNRGFAVFFETVQL